MDLRSQQLKRYLRDLRGDDQVDLFRFSVSSLQDRTAYAKFHLDEAKRLMAPFTQGEGPRPGDDHKLFGELRVHTAAHLLACLQNLHSCADICAHVVYYGLGSNLDPSPLKERDIGVPSVLRRIPASPISSGLRSLVEDAEFVYLDAMVNRSKHRAVIKTPYTFESRNSVEADAWHGIKFWGFERGGTSYPNRRSEEFLEAELHRQLIVLPAIAAALEQHLLEEWNEQKRIYEMRGDRWPRPRFSGNAE